MGTLTLEEREVKLVTREGTAIPPRTMVMMDIEPTIPGREGEPWLIEPSADLTKRKGLSTGNAIVKNDQPLLRVLMLNMSD